MRYFSMFAGIAGFEKGIEDAEESYRQQQTVSTFRGCGDSISIKTHQCHEPEKCWHESFRCIGYSEINKYAGAIYQYHYPNHKNYGDCRTINPDELPDLDLIVGGFPCQSFSFAGQRGGLSDIRGMLFAEICRIARVKRPAYLFLENVKGLLSAPYTENIQTWNEEDFNGDGVPTANALKTHKAIDGTKGWVFLTILNSLWELGYDCQWQVLNSKNHGIPQNRERVFIIGHSRDRRRPKVFPIGEVNQVSGELSQETQGERQRIRHEDNQLASALRVGGSGVQDNLVSATNSSRYCKDGTDLLVRVPNIIVPTLQGGGHSGGLHSDMALIEVTDNMPLSRRVYSPAGISPSVTTPSGGHHLPQILTKTNVRRLTPTECERLQGFPDGWTKYGLFEDGIIRAISDTQRYKALGNAVTTKVIRDIILNWSNTE